MDLYPGFQAGRQDADRSGRDARAPLCHLYGRADDPFGSVHFHPAWSPARGAWQSAVKHSAPLFISALEQFLFNLTLKAHPRMGHRPMATTLRAERCENEQKAL
jgi:hypothetical protein